MTKTVPIIIAIIGVVLVAGGASSYVAKSSSTVACEACGMEIEKDNISTMELVSQSQTHWACCPVCAMVIGIYYENVTLQASCYSCSESISIEFDSGNITSVDPSNTIHNVTMLFGMACMKNKLVCSNDCADHVRAEYDWAAELPTKTVMQTRSIAETKLAQFTVGYKQIEVPTITYGLIIGGLVLLAISPLEWFYIEKKKTAKTED